jgi:hypothetical protein
MDKVRRDFDTCRESHGRHAQPEQFSAEKQNYEANQRANDADGKMHWRKEILDSHGGEAFLPEAFLFDPCA